MTIVLPGLTPGLVALFSQQPALRSTGVSSGPHSRPVAAAAEASDS